MPSRPPALLFMLLVAMLGFSSTAEARALSVTRAKAVTRGEAAKVMSQMTRTSARRGGRATVRSCRRRSRRSVRCGLDMVLTDGRDCRNAKVTVAMLSRSERVARRFHRRWMRCRAARGKRIAAVEAKRKPPEFTPTPTTPPLTTQPGSFQRLFGTASPWNQQLGTGPALHPNSSTMVALLNQEVATNGWPIASGAWTNTIYYADASTPKQDVELTHTSFAGRKLLGVPIPTSAQVPGDSDGGLVVIDRSTNCEYDFARAARTADGRWSAWIANALPTTDNGVYPFATAPSASGFASAGGMIMPEELAAGRIEHALAFTMKNAKLGGPVAPATGSDGRSALAGAIPEGARLQLDPNLNLDALGLRPWEKTIAQALQEYGMYLVDTGGAVALRVQHSQSTDYAYPWGASDYGQMPTGLARHLRVLNHGPQFATQYQYVTNKCNALSS